MIPPSKSDGNIQSIGFPKQQYLTPESGVYMYIFDDKFAP
jgi:hypothetical protein